MACKKSMPMPAADHKYCAMEEVHMGTEGKPHNNRDYNRNTISLINYYMWHIQINAKSNKCNATKESSHISVTILKNYLSKIRQHAAKIGSYQKFERGHM